jgi:bifunctional DNA-binding transcriptional regulator/antitoxin component of YhaV-PrlF toxin-antitoxin module
MNRCLNMRLQKQLSRKVEGKSYSKYVITIPPKDIEKLGWKEGIELKVDIKHGKAILHPLKDEEHE